MNLLAQLTFDRPVTSKGSGYHAANFVKRESCHVKIRSALNEPDTVKGIIKKTGLSQGFLGRYIKQLEDEGCVKRIGQTISAQCRKSSNLWVWVGEMNVIGQLMMMDRKHAKTVTAQERKIEKINLFRNAVSGVFTIKQLSDALGYHDAYVGQRIRIFEKKGLAKCVGTGQNPTGGKPHNLWVWV